MTTPSNSKFKFNCGTLVLNTAIGAVITYIILAIFMFSFQDAGFLILASIVCTLGISLVVWFPIWFLVGFLVMLGIRFLNRQFGQSEPQNHQTNPAKKETDKPSLTSDQQALVTYIKRAVGKGLDQAKIKQNLEKNGWTLDSINWALDFVQANNNA